MKSIGYVDVTPEGYNGSMKNSIAQQLDEIARKINEGWLDSTAFWGGAGVVITDVEPSPSEPGFYPDPAVVVTPNAGELSWLFVLLRDVSIALDDYGVWKQEFFGRLAAAAQSVPSDTDVKLLLLQVIRQAYEMLGMIEIGMQPAEFSMIILHPRRLGRGVNSFDRGELTTFYASRGIVLS
jgi:hypothetical protein